MKRFQSLLLPLGALVLPGCFFHHDDDDGGDDFTIVASTSELEPNDESASPHFLGVLRHGEEMRVSGVVDATTDEFDGFAISLTKVSEIEFELVFDDLSGELDVWVYDPAADDIALFFEDDFSPDRDTFEVHEPVLDFQIIVRAFSGTSAYDLTVRARPVPFLHFPATSNDDGAGGASKTGIARSLAHSAAERALSPAERAEVVATYLGRVAPPARFEELPERIGTLYVVDDEGNLETAPVLRLPDGHTFVDLDAERSGRED